MDRITVRGRTLRTPTCKVVPGEGGITLRLDDHHNPEFWVEVFLSNDALARIAAAQLDVYPFGANNQVPQFEDKKEDQDSDNAR